MANQIALSGFVANQGTAFRVILSEAQTIDLTLHSVKERPAHADGFECFSLIFQGSKDIFLGQGTYVLNHEYLGQTEVFLVPVGQTEKVFEYQAVFSQKKMASQ